MKRFRVNGIWQLEDSQDPTIVGRVVYSKKGLRLTLLGNPKQSSGWDNDYRYKMVRGVVESSPYGLRATLFDGFTTNTSSNSGGFRSETIRFTWGFFGDDFYSESEIIFDNLDLKFSHLNEWVYVKNNYNFDMTHLPNYSGIATYTMPGPIRFKFAGKPLEVRWNFSAPQTRNSVKIKESTQIRVSGIGDLEPMNVNQSFVLPLQNLLTFATDNLNAIDDVHFIARRKTLGDMRKDLHLVYDPIYRQKKRTDTLYQHEMLFTLTDAQKSNIDIFQRWFEFSSKFKDFITVYFSHLYSPPRYLDDKLASLVRAFSLYCSVKFGISEQAKAVAELQSAEIAARFNSWEAELLIKTGPLGSELDVPNHMLALIEENRDVMSRIIRVDLKNFVQEVFSTIHFIEHRKSVHGLPALDGAKLYYLIEKLRWLIKVVLLKELGFTNENVSEIAERNRIFGHLKSV